MIFVSSHNVDISSSHLYRNIHENSFTSTKSLTVLPSFSLTNFTSKLGVASTRSSFSGNCVAPSGINEGPKSKFSSSLSGKYHQRLVLCLSYKIYSCLNICVYAFFPATIYTIWNVRPTIVFTF